jgi:hypothetical protein
MEFFTSGQFVLIVFVIGLVIGGGIAWYKRNQTPKV